MVSELLWIIWTFEISIQDKRKQKLVHIIITNLKIKCLSLSKHLKKIQFYEVKNILLIAKLELINFNIILNKIILNTNYDNTVAPLYNHTFCKKNKSMFIKKWDYIDGFLKSIIKYGQKGCDYKNLVIIEGFFLYESIFRKSVTI